MRLSTGKLVSERIRELIDEVHQRGMVPCEILLGEKAYQLLKKECRKSLKRLNPRGESVFVDHKKSVSDKMFFLGLEVTELDSESSSPEGMYVAVNRTKA